MNNVDLLFNRIEKGREGKNVGLKTGIEKFDKYTGGIQRGVYTLVFGLSGSGKSSFVLYANIYRPLKDYPDKDIKLIYYSLELSAELLLAKLMCLYIYEEFGRTISYTDLMSWQEILSDEDYECVKASKAWLDSIQDKLIIFDKQLNANSFYATMMPLLKQWGDFEESDDGKRKIYIKHNPEQYVIVVIDHIGLCTPQSGNTKKQEIDMISQYAVRLRERCQVSFYVLQQENRNSSDMDRRKADMTECSSEDLKDSGNTFNDCEVCIGIYYPLKHKVKTHRGYPIIIENAQGNFIGLRDRYRNAILIKNRLGVSDRTIPLNFFGEIGLFRSLPKADVINDYMPYLYLDSNKKDETIKTGSQQNQPLKFSL